MKKFLLIAGCVAAFAAFGSSKAQAVEAPEATVMPQIYDFPPYGYFNNIDVIYWKEEGKVPYTLSINPKYLAYNDVKPILNEEGLKLVKVYKNVTEELDILEVGLVEWQEDENTQNYENAWFDITMYDFVGLMEDDPSYYSVYISPDLYYIDVDGVQVANTELTLSFSLNKETSFQVPDAVLNPAEGVVSSLEKVEITWPNANDVLCLLKMFHEDLITVTYNGTKLEGWEIEWGWDTPDNQTDDQNGNIMYVNLGKEYTTPGTYVINVPKAVMWVSDLDDNGTLDNPAYKWTYQVVAEPQPLAAPTVVPAAGEVTSLSTITLTWDDEVVLENGETGGNVTLTLDGKEIEGLTLETAVKDNVVTVTLNEEQTAAGTYALNVPEGYVLYNTADGYTYYNEVVNVEYTILPSEVAPGVLPQPTKVTPENSALVEELSMVTLSWENAEVTLNPDCEDQPVLSQLGSSSTYYAEASISNGSLVLEFVDVPKGAYSLLIPAGYVMALIDDVPYLSPEIALTYGVNGESTGIESIKAAVEKGEVYNLQGVRVANPQHGLYIINGKKVLVK